MRELAAIPTRSEQMLWFEETPGAFYAGAGGKPPALNETLKLIAQVEKKHQVTIHIVDARAVCGPAHFASALMHARRAKERGRARARDPKVELMVYLSGNRQIERAIKRAGIGPRCHGVGVAIEGGAQAAWEAQVAVLHALDLSRRDEQLAASEAKAKAIGVSGKAEGVDGWEALAIEVVAALDLE